ncbi:MAG: hypothetical protein EBR82_78635 [Caulobacteraceae bacterium]|nr:hypothetical protein [Caulobacteraceae bacterium]
MDAEWIVFNGKLKRSMWPHECAEWVAGHLGVKPYDVDADPVTWLALVLERRTDPHGVRNRLLAALDDAPEGTFTDEDWTQEHRAEARAYDRYVNDRAEGHGRREGREQ